MVREPDRPGEVGGAGDAGDAASADGVWEDRRVLEGVRRRDAEALGRFFDASFPYVYSLAYRLTGNREAAEDVAQDVFLKVYRAADRLDVDRHPRPWLTTITYNACRDAARRSSARPETPTDPTTIGERNASGDTPEDALMGKEKERLIEAALLALDEESRAVVILHDYCGTPHDEIAGIMGLSHAAVRKRYSRALKQMEKTIRGLM
jgi:RNA polymerase sigma factor (sigma-70 family)